MKEIIYHKIDAFSTGRSSGNPAGVVYLKEGETLTPQEMHEIAKGQKGIVSEVVFCTPVGPDRFSLHYYSSECEVEFCGHGSIACMYTLIRQDRRLAACKQLIIETRRGALSVINDPTGSGAVLISAPDPEYLGCEMSREKISSALGLSSARLGDGQHIGLVDGGLRTLIVPLLALNDVLDTRPDIDVLSKFCRDHDVDIVLVFCSETADRANSYRTRVFAPKYGYLEDPATGSGNSAFGYQLLNNGMWSGESISIEQGPDRECPNIIRLGTVRTEGGRRVVFGGSATVRYEQRLMI